jgi:conserved oligomeric Golgi complex subunit 4
MYYITVVTTLLEHVAHIIDQHQPVVEKHYGTGKMKMVTLSILEECDRIIHRLLIGWEEERAIKRKVNVNLPFLL